MTDAPADDRSTRWKPLRAGIRNIWEYDDQVFTFADGRAILRGPNGSGKSNALALLFPFLIDGTMSASAMDPFAGGRSMRSLLLGVVRDDDPGRGRFRHDQRLGYVWMELARTADGREEHVTIGCGARATAQRDANAWFFVTGRRVGVDLDLAPDGEVLTRGRLIEVLGSESVTDTAEAHRAAVDRALFGFGADRHRKLVGLIRVLRRPQLAGKLDPDLLSTVLTEGLPALSGDVLDAVATSLDHLEATQREVDELRATRSVVDAFLPVYRRYLEAEAADRVGAVLDAVRARTRAARAARAAEAEIERTTEALATNEAERVAADRAHEAALGEQRAAVEAPAFQDAASLREAADGAERAESQAERDKALAKEAASLAARALDEASEAAGAADDASAEAERALTEVVDAADRADAAWTLSEEEAVDPDQLATGLRVVERARRAGLAEVRAALHDRDAARHAHRQAEQSASEALRTADQAGEARDRAQADLAAARTALRDAVEAWLSDTPGLDEDGRADVVATVDRLGEPGAAAPLDRYRDLVAAEREALAAAAARAEDHLAALEAEVEELGAERTRVETEVDPGPAPPAWRRADRTGRPGAPLWACCDFAQPVPADDRAGLEAALAAAGLLDAWVHPAPADGDDRPGTPPVASAADLDSWLDAAAPVAEDGPRLSAALVPLPPPDSGLTAERVAAVLDAVALGDVGVAVDPSGRFRLGPLSGRAPADGAEFIGAEARAARRRRRLAEIDAELERLAALRAAGQAERDRTVAARRAIDEAEQRAPAATAVLDAHAAWVERRVRADEVATAAERATAREAALAAEADRRAKALGEVAARHRTGTEAEDLDGLDRLLGELGRLGAAAVEARRTAIDRDERAAREATRAKEQVGQSEARRAEAAASRADATRLRARADALQRERGAAVEAAVARARAADGRVDEARSAVRRLGDRRASLSEAHGVARQAVTDTAADVERAQARLAGVSGRVAVLRRRDVLALLLPEVAPTPDVDPDGRPPAGRDPQADRPQDEATGPVATDVADRPAGETDLPADPEAFADWLAGRLGRARPDDDERSRVRAGLDRAQKVLLDELHHAYAPSLAHDDDLTLVEVTSDVGTVPLARLVRELADQQERLELLLTEGDREVFERFLLGQVAEELRLRLTEAAEFVAGVNAALADAPTASGLRVELRWELAGDDAGVRDAVRLLGHDTKHLSADDLATLRSFFERVIAEQRAERFDGGYRTVLEAALDYRSWHVFRPYLRTPTGGATRLTRTTFRQLSGGEQAVALHLPLFAAAAAHYGRAEATAPRLIALDEAFAGIDEAMRGELMGLTVRFDLDLVMTGHELWGAYAQVPEVAVHDLLRRPPAEGVSVVSLRWRGGEMRSEDDGG